MTKEILLTSSANAGLKFFLSSFAASLFTEMLVFSFSSRSSDGNSKSWPPDKQKRNEMY